MSSLDKITPEQEHLLDEFTSRVRDAATELFGEDAALVFGIQWGDMGRDPEQATCFVASSLPLCIVGSAIQDMAAEVEMLHRTSHGLPEVEEQGEDFAQEVALSDAPEEVQAMVRSLMEQMGVSEEQVVVVNHVSTSDLAAMPTADEPEPGDPAGVEGTDD